MKRIILTLLALLLLPTFFFHLRGQDRRAVYNSFSIGLGGQKITDEYLSPLNYGGWAISVQMDKEMPIAKIKPLMFYSHLSVQFAETLNPSRTAAIVSFRGEGLLVPHYLFSLQYGIKIGLGTGVRASFGTRLHSRNGNNPITLDAKADWIVSSLLAYRLPFRKWPVAIRLRTHYGLLGVANSLAYGSSYYEESFIGKGIANAVAFTHIANSFHTSSSLNFDIPFWNLVTLQLGCKWDVDRAFLNNRLTYMHSIVGTLGIAFERISFFGRKASYNKQYPSLLFDTTY